VDLIPFCHWTLHLQWHCGLSPLFHSCLHLSNAVHGVNINLLVCVSVCMSVTLSVNSPTSQTPQRIFTVDSLKDANLRKDVPFGGLDHE